MNVQKIKEIIFKVESDIKRTAKIKDKLMNADLIKTIKAIGYEDIKSVMAKELND